MYHSQYGQDKWLEEAIFQGKRQGVFLDIGAADGVELSNTLFFERERGWRGFCFEPNPKVFEKLNGEGVRESPCRPEAVWTEDCVKEFTVIDGYSEMLSGLTETYDPAHVQRVAAEVAQHNQTVAKIKVQCRNINTVLDQLGAYITSIFTTYSGVDFLSIDTEGSEFAILQAIDYDKHRIRAIACENNYADSALRDLMRSKGFEFRLRTGVDDIYINTTI